MKRQAVGNAADPEQVERAAQRDERSRERYLDALNNTMNTRDGRIVMRTLLNACGIGIGEDPRNPFDNSGSVTAHNCGQLFIGQALQRDLKEACPKLYHTMEDEAQQTEATNG